MKDRRALVALLWLVALGGVVLAQLLRSKDAPSVVEHETRITRSRVITPELAAAPRMLGGDRRHRGRSTLRGPSAPVLAWSVSTGAPVVAQPIVDARGRVVVGSLDGHLYVIDARTGELVFRKALGGPIYGAALALDDGTIVVGTDGHAVLGLDPEGELRFRIATSGDADTSPTLAPDGTIRFCAGSELWSITSTGQTRFRFRAGGRIFSSPAVRDDGVTLFGAQDDHVYGVSPEGHELFRYRAGGDVDASPAIADDGTALVGANDGYVHALDLDGRLRFRLRVEASVRAPISLWGDELFVGTLGPQPKVLAARLADASVRFTFELSRSAGSDLGVMSGILVDAEGGLYFGGHEHYLYAIDREGRLRWAFETRGTVAASPILVGEGAMVFGSEDGTIRAIVSGEDTPGARGAR